MCPALWWLFPQMFRCTSVGCAYVLFGKLSWVHRILKSCLLKRDWQMDRWIDIQSYISTKIYCSMLTKHKTQSPLVNVFSDCDHLISFSHVTSSQGPNSHPLKCSDDFPLSATLAALYSLSFLSSLMLCTLGNTVHTIYHGKSSSKNKQSKHKKASTVK